MKEGGWQRSAQQGANPHSAFGEMAVRSYRDFALQLLGPVVVSAIRYKTDLVRMS